MDFKVFVIEDDKASRQLIIDMLETVGIENVVPSLNGRIALGKLQDIERLHLRKPDLIICDWNMPGMNGLQFFKTAKNEGLVEKIPFLMVSAENEKEKVIEAMKIGISDYLIKPYSSIILTKKVLQLLKI